MAGWSGQIGFVPSNYFGYTIRVSKESKGNVP